MARKLAEGKKVVIELDSEGFENVFYRNKIGNFLNAVQKIGIGRLAALPKGTKAFIMDEEGGVIGQQTFEKPKPQFTPVTPRDLQRAAELERPLPPEDHEGLPLLEPFGPVEPE